MADFLQAALDLLGRPGNAVRGALIDGPQGLGRGLSGQRQYDPTELPGINQLPDQGVSLGPLNLTPRTVAGFGASALLDPLTYAGGGLGKLGEGLLGASRGAEGISGLDRALSQYGGVTSNHFQIPTSGSILGETSGYAGDAMSDPIEHLLDHANGIQPGHQIVADSPSAAEAQVAASTGSEAHQVSPGRQPGQGVASEGYQNVVPGTAQLPPAAEPTPLGNQKYAQARDKIGQVQGQLAKIDNVGGDAAQARNWLDSTSTGPETGGASHWEDVIGVKRGSNPEDPAVLAKQEGSYRDYGAGTRDLSQGPGTEWGRVNNEPVQADRQQILNHLSSVQQQIEDLSTKLGGQSGSRYGDPLEQRGMEKTLSDAVARQQLKGTPELQQARQAIESSSTSRLPGLSAAQEGRAYRQAGAQELSKAESFRRAPDSRYYNGGTPEAAADEANLPLAERNTRAPHGDPLEEDRARKETQDKFGRAGAGTYQSGDRGTQLGVDANQRGVGGRGFTEEITPGRPGDYSRVVTQHVDEPTAGQKTPPRGQEAQSRAANPNLEQELDAIRRMILAEYRPPTPPPFNRYLGR